MKTHIPFTLLQSGHIVVEIRLNSQLAVFIVDTGASYSVVHTNQTDRLGMTSEHTTEKAVGAGTENIPITMSRNNQGEIGELQIKDWDIALMDLAHVNRAFDELDIPRVDGVLGADVLIKYAAIINYRNSEMTLHYS